MTFTTGLKQMIFFEGGPFQVIFVKYRSLFVGLYCKRDLSFSRKAFCFPEKQHRLLNPGGLETIKQKGLF